MVQIFFISILPNTDSMPDDPEIYDGAHVSVQLIGRRLSEEKTLAIAEYVGKTIGK